MMGSRYGRGGDNRDCFSRKSRRLVVWKRAETHRIKTLAARQNRRAVRREIRTRPEQPSD